MLPSVVSIEDEPITLRHAGEDDLAYVLKTWVRSYKPLSRIPAQIYDREHIGVIRRILSGERTRIVIASPEDSPTGIVGWACADDEQLHYVYVPFALRGKGLARELIKAALLTYPKFIEVSHRFQSTPRPDAKGNYHCRFLFNPYRLGVQ